MSNKTSSRRALSAERRNAAMQMRSEGATLQQIGDALGISRQAVQRHVFAALDQLAEETRHATEQLRALELARIDQAWAAIWPLVEQGDLQAVDRAIRLSDLRCRLLGLHAPTRIAPTDPSGVAEYSGGGLAALLASVRNRPGRNVDATPLRAPGGGAGASPRLSGRRGCSLTKR